VKNSDLRTSALLSLPPTSSESPTSVASVGWAPARLCEKFRPPTSALLSAPFAPTPVGRPTGSPSS
jgi:hypothetical protein